MQILCHAVSQFCIITSFNSFTTCHETDIIIQHTIESLLLFSCANLAEGENREEEGGERGDKLVHDRGSTFTYTTHMHAVSSPGSTDRRVDLHTVGTRDG